MTVPREFMKTLFVNGVGLAVWISLLLLANMVVPLFFITTIEAQLVLVATMAGAFAQMAIFASKGFVKLLGIGHIFWVPLLPWLWPRLEGLHQTEPFAVWIVAVLVLNGVSLVIDARDVWRYIAGDRMPRRPAG